MYRRTFFASSILLVAGSIRVSSAAFAQQAGKTYRIGILGIGSAAQYASRMNAFRKGLQDLGWASNQIAFYERWAGGHYEQSSALATELVALNVDVILATGGTPSAEAAMKATSTIPIVFAVVNDPVGEKIVQSLAHPGGNITGVTNMGDELYPKRLALVNEAVPGVKRVLYVANGANPTSLETTRLSQLAGQNFGIQVEAFDVRDARDFERAFENASRRESQAVVAGADTLFLGGAKELGGLALRYRLPLISGFHDVGVLLAYNVDYDERYGRAAAYVDKILKGAKPGDLPVEQPAKFKLIVDLKTAKALGITLPQSLVLRADEVIQ
jgi:putative ABC transport system substrate-binding protein